MRRRQGERFDFEQMKKIAAWAREHGVGLHLDGARIFLESAYTARPVKEYAALFDTVYVSMYKYFNAAAGAVLAGPKRCWPTCFRRGECSAAGYPQVWPFAAVALHYMEGFEQRFRSSVETAERVITVLRADSNFGVEAIPNGTNIFRLRVFNVNAPVYKLRLEDAGSASRTPWATGSACKSTRPGIACRQGRLPRASGRDWLASSDRARAHGHDVVHLHGFLHHERLAVLHADQIAVEARDRAQPLADLLFVREQRRRPRSSRRTATRSSTAPPCAARTAR